MVVTRRILYMVGVVMINQRQNLLHLLQDAYALALDVEQSLRRLGKHYASHVPFVNLLEGRLKETLDQQRLLAECLCRIDGESKTRATNEELSEDDKLASANEAQGNVLHEMARIRALIRQEIAVYSSCIVTAESSGFFETRLACEAILFQKSELAACLSESET
jgi:ferritin-like metal-binding protein YciE